MKISDLARRAGIGGTTLATIEELEKHPEAALVPAAGLAALGVNELFPGMGVHRPGLGIGSALTHPLGRGMGRPSGFGKTVSPQLQTLIAAMDATGQTVEGLQPWHVSGYVNVASASAIAASADIADMFATAQTRAFSAADTFPWTFLCKRFRCALNTEPVDGAAEDGAWARQLCLRFVVATEVGRISLDAFGADRIIQSPSNAPSSSGTANQIWSNPGVPFPVIFEKNGTYQMFLHTDFPITTTKPFSFSYQMDGWVVQNTSALSEAGIVNSLGSLLGSTAERYLAP